MNTIDDDFFGLGDTPKKTWLETQMEKSEEKLKEDSIKTILSDNPTENIIMSGDFDKSQVIINQPLDRYGKCPNSECKENWNIGDILENIRKIQAFGNKSEEELVNIAFHGFGYQKSNPKNFSKVIAIQIINDSVHTSTDLNPNRSVVNPDFYMCPKCRQVWDANTGQHYNSIYQAKKLWRINNEYDSKELPNTH